MDKQLLDSFARLGLPMFVAPGEALDANATLAGAVRAKEMRVWEGFPVLLANAAEDFRFSFEQVEAQLSENALQLLFRRLVLVSLAVYALYDLSFPWTVKVEKELSAERKTQLAAWKKSLRNDRPFGWAGVEFDPRRLREMFELYFEQTAEKGRRKREKLQEYSLEYALSQVFSPKQKELFKKRLDGLPMTKTEQEYYSRTVKKKVVALANDDLHTLARKLLEQ
ncbi:hypothetical protein [Geothermobacter hydrogeniphilus]|nr:hypothetical protein [Geothermobacter hydrogeniphilus]